MELPEHSKKEILIESRQIDDGLPLQLQAQIKGLRISAIIMVFISILSVYFILWAPFYIYLAYKLKPAQLPNRKLVKGAAIATLPLCLGLIPILVDIEFWKMNKRLKEFEEIGPKAFISDKEFLAGEPKRKRNSTIVWFIFLLLVAIFIGLIVVAVSSNSTNNSTTALLTNEKSTPYTSAEHGFKINFPGLPESERQTLEDSGYKIPYTIYSADTDNGSKAYLVSVYDFTGIDLNETGALEGAVNGAVQNTEGATLIRSNFSTFKGLKSIDAYYTVPADGITYNGYIKAFIKGGKMFALITVGANEAEFNEYASTFTYTQ